MAIHDYHPMVYHGVRRLAREGHEADAIARRYHITPEDVRRILEPPRPRPRRRPPRSPGWARRRDADELPPVAAIAAGDVAQHDQADVIEPPAVAIEAWPVPPPSGDWGAMHAARPGMLDADAVRRLRELRAAGWSIEDLARRFEVSISTIKRGLKPSYRPSGPPIAS
jgi:uncharacterized protein (DUF433 family)